MFTLYGNIATFYPPYTARIHPTVTETMVGVVLAMFEGGILITSPLVGLLLQKVGRKNFIIIGNICMIASSVGFGLTVYIDNDIAFFVVSVLLRTIQGFGDSAASTAIYSIIGSEFPGQTEILFGYFEASVGIGLMIGPVIGQLIFSAVGYEKTFYWTAFILSLPLILQLIFIPNKINKSK
jgi:MFS family permease